MKDIKYTFRLLNGDEEIEKVLSNLHGQNRANYIREALKSYISYGEKIKSINDNLKLLLHLAEQGKLISDKHQETVETLEDHEEPLNDTDKFLADSIQNLLDI